ncbi:hypothetical protein LTR94_025675 [Friedmanniomyces endolithicus]|nr:hypothetical protein LTR94_025675 [Friedmanniomyces endolithicus]
MGEIARSRSPAGNVWETAGLGRDEVRISKVLAWWLNPLASHGLAIPLAEALWREAVGAGGTEFDVGLLRRSAVEVCPLADQGDRVDVALEGDDFILFIEVKVDAGLQPDQLSRYALAAERAAFLRNKARYHVIYLAPAPTALPANCVWISWRQTARALVAASSFASNAYDQQSALQFAEYMKRFERA